MTRARHLGLDLGGTNVKWVTLERSGRSLQVLTRGQLPTRAEQGPQAVAERLAEMAVAAAAEVGGVATAALGVPGRYYPERGAVRMLPNLPGDWDGLPAAAIISRAVGVPTAIINDARAFTLAELRLGAGRGARTLIGLTLGTGVGGGLAFDGRVRLGQAGTAGEIGHQTILPEGRLCGCGNRGCLETLTQASAISAACAQPSPEEAVRVARAGDPRALAGLDQIGRYLGIGLANVLVIVGPARIVIGGGVSEAGDLLFDPIRAEMARRVHIVEMAEVRVVAAELGTWAGAVGAALHGAEAASMPARRRSS